jgi:hypothetical protein
VGLTTAGFRSTLVNFGSTEKTAIEMFAVTISLDRRLSKEWNFAVALGSVLAGRLETATEAHFIEQGAVGSIAFSRTFLEAKGALPFLIVSASLTASYNPTRAGPYIGTDIRAAGTLGWTLWDRFSPYLSARLFGGIAAWRQRIYSDQWHFQVGAGFVVGLPGGFDFNAEFIPLGEQRFSAGVGYSF